MATELIRYEIDGGSVVVETNESIGGWAPAASIGGRVIHDARQKFQDAFTHVRDAAQEALHAFRDSVDDSKRPDEVEIEFGVKVGLEAGAVIASTAMEGQLTVRLRWVSEHAPPDTDDD